MYRALMLPLLALLIACDSSDSMPEPEASEPVTAAPEMTGERAVAEASEPTSQPSEGVHASATGADASAWDDLFAMDPRTPVPLQPMMAWHQKQNMMEHLVAIQRITAALAESDWDGVAEASALIESSPQMAQMCNHMGAGAPGFTELALEFHRRADGIAVAAAAEDTAGVLRATSHTLEACTSCHSAFRQDVVDAATWAERTGAMHDPTMHHGGH